MLRVLAPAVFAVAAVLGTAAPTGAVETAEFGLRPADAGQTSWELAIPTGGDAHDTLVVYNRSNEQLTIRLGAVAISEATADRSRVSLGGPSERVSFEQDSVPLQPGASARVGFRVGPGSEPGVAITALSDRDGAIVQRLAVVAWTSPAPAPPGSPAAASASLAGPAAVAAVAAVAVAGAAGRRLRRSHAA